MPRCQYRFGTIAHPNDQTGRQCVMPDAHGGAHGLDPLAHTAVISRETILRMEPLYGLASGELVACGQVSAFVVDPKHIEYLVSAAVLYRSHDRGCVNEAAAMLEEENRKSVAYRYKKVRGASAAVFGEGGRSPRLTCHVTPVQTLKAVRCYEYQSCEHPGWAESEARDFCEALMHAAIHHLPGYEEAAWEIT